MVLLNKIYTRTGDGGATRLANGAEVSKTDLRVEAYGSVDETNACLGLVRLHTAEDDLLHPMLERIQNDLFDLGADLANPPKADEDPALVLRVTDGQVARLEHEIDQINDALSPLTSFVLAATCIPSAAPTLARSAALRFRTELLARVQSMVKPGAMAASCTAPWIRDWLIASLSNGEPSHVNPPNSASPRARLICSHFANLMSLSVRGSYHCFVV
ncbi:MAG: ATP:cob(I)alamin adenosyltransferase [Caulobacterales bacterium 32-67-6]|nr:MAG: ATP:cob(I)alamin adenosyltransferase [Caulobacterales bacterium 32-67-6]